MDNWSELHPKRCNFLQNSHFSSTFSDFQKAYEGEIWCLSTACDFIVCIRSHQLWIVNVILNLWLQKVFILKIVTKRSLSCHKSPIFCPCTIVYWMQKKRKLPITCIKSSPFPPPPPVEGPPTPCILSACHKNTKLEKEFSKTSKFTFDI